MQCFFVLFSILVPVLAQYPDSRPQYRAPPTNPYLAPHMPPQENEVNDTPMDLKVIRHVFVHSVPDDEPQESRIRRIRGPGGDEKHVSIIFVKAPAPAVPDKQVVDVQNDGGKKTLVYVLLKKSKDQPDVQFNPAPPTAASKPDVFFIRYKDAAKATTPAPPKQPVPSIYNGPLSGYGAPSQEGYNK